MAKTLAYLHWIEDLLHDLLPGGFTRKHMFGGFAYYVNNQIVLVLFENESKRTYKELTYKFDLWNGCLFPTSHEHHQKIKELFPFLRAHPVLTKWMYLPLQTEDFDHHVESVLKEIRRRSKLFGVVPKPKKNKKKVSINQKAKYPDTKKPQMFQLRIKN